MCGAPVPAGARACPECGADERTGWDEEATRTDGLDLPDESFGDGPENLQRSGDDASSSGRSPAVSWLAGLGLLLLALALFAYLFF